METSDTRQGSRALLPSNPRPIPEPDPRAAQTASSSPIADQPPGQPSLSDSDHSPSSPFPVLNRRGRSGGAPVWPQLLMTGDLSSPLTPLQKTCPGFPWAPSSGSVLRTEVGVHPVSSSKSELLPRIHADADLFLLIKPTRTLASGRIRFQGH